MRTSFFLLLAVCGALAVGPARADGLTSAQVVQRCEQAYGALRSYEVTASVTSIVSGKAFTDGLPRTYGTLANIRFLHPGRIRAYGTDILGNRFAYVSDGRRTYQYTSGHWSKDADTEAAIAATTGSGMSAATTVPALLLHTNWANPFPAAWRMGRDAALDTVDGHACYTVSTTDGADLRAFWIDRKTFLLRRFTSYSSISGLRQDERFSSERINAAFLTEMFKFPEVASEHD